MTGDEQRNTDAPEAGDRPAPGPAQPLFTTAELFGRATEIGIVHGGLVYRLRITRQGKLVLNK